MANLLQALGSVPQHLVVRLFDFVAAPAHIPEQVVILFGLQLGLVAFIIKFVSGNWVKLLQELHGPVPLLTCLGTAQHVNQFRLCQGGTLHHGRITSAKRNAKLNRSGLGQVWAKPA
eukprot:CAMPEP_0172817806 /NCGR_PEP_ID=MMETSP1075-20121228/13486_1 /TAXON_ID=2916 /ORGANISM="Ceratium fusus, Strain PA161109" /LENGTH=116 /DNA_ID=CAMNT_0013658083 /DNA_START=229 /DNA_END=575 /DNA_ORIENTATION=+